MHHVVYLDKRLYYRYCVSSLTCVYKYVPVNREVCLSVHCPSVCLQEKITKANRKLLAGEGLFHCSVNFFKAKQAQYQQLLSFLEGNLA